MIHHTVSFMIIIIFKINLELELRKANTEFKNSLNYLLIIINLFLILFLILEIKKMKLIIILAKILIFKSNKKIFYNNIQMIQLTYKIN